MKTLVPSVDLIGRSLSDALAARAMAQVVLERIVRLGKDMQDGGPEVMRRVA